MKLRTALLATVGCAFVACAGSVSAQNAAKPAAKPAAAPAQPRRSSVKHLLYIATPGDQGADGQSGVIVLDADHNYVFLKRIPYGLPASEMPGAGVKGITASVPENKLYVAADRLYAIDLATDKVAWVYQDLKRNAGAENGKACCERPWMLPDGETLFVAASVKPWWYYIDAKTGKELGIVETPLTDRSHNLGISEDGKLGALGSISGGGKDTTGKAGVAVVDIPSRKVLRYITFSDAVRPLTINHDGSLVYANVNGLDGFEIGDTATGKMIKRVELPGDLWKAKWANPNGFKFGHGLPSHGIGMTPDESEIWVTDGANAAWQVWDNPGDGRNPVYNPLKTVKTLQPDVASAWISMTDDGKLAFTGDGTIIDVRAHKAIGLMKDEYGRVIHAAEKVLYMTFDQGKLVATSNQFAMGHKTAYDARMAREGQAQKQASNN